MSDGEKRSSPSPDVLTDDAASALCQISSFVAPPNDIACRNLESPTSVASAEVGGYLDWGYQLETHAPSWLVPHGGPLLPR